MIKGRVETEDVHWEKTLKERSVLLFFIVVIVDQDFIVTVYVKEEQLIFRFRVQ